MRFVTTINRKPLRSFAVSILALVTYFTSLAVVEQRLEAAGFMDCVFDFPNREPVAFTVRSKVILSSGRLDQGPEKDEIAIKHLPLRL